MIDDFEARVGSVLGADPSDADLRPADVRVRAAIERPAGRQRIAIRLTAPVLAVAALVLLVGATGGAIALYGLFGGDAWQYAWNHATRLGVSQEREGYKVTLEAAYADSAQLMLAITAIDSESRGWSGTEAGSADVQLIGESEPTYVMTGGGSTPAAMGSANTVWLDAVTPPSPGVHSFHVTVPAIRYREAEPVAGDIWHEVLGPWTFTVDLPVVAGQTFDINSSASVGGVTATVVGFSAAPTRVDIDVRWTDRPAGTAWTSVGTAFHDGRRVAIAGTAEVDGRERLSLVSGTTTPSGHWKVVIEQTVQGAGDRSETRLPGPWVIEFDIP